MSYTFTATGVVSAKAYALYAQTNPVVVAIPITPPPVQTIVPVIINGIFRGIL